MHLSSSAVHETTAWLGTLLSVAAGESRTERPGGENVLARLSELMFVETIRRYLETLPPAQTGWLARLRDPLVGQALAALHGQPGEDWTVERLARVVGLSRSVLAERFMQMFRATADAVPRVVAHAARLPPLADGGQVAAVAGAVGYESEAAFSRAFKKLVGQAPATWRRATASVSRV